MPSNSHLLALRRLLIVFLDLPKLIEHSPSSFYLIVCCTTLHTTLLLLLLLLVKFGSDKDFEAKLRRGLGKNMISAPVLIPPQNLYNSLVFKNSKNGSHTHSYLALCSIRRDWLKQKGDRMSKRRKASR